MRAILIDWLVEVHLKFKLQHPTLWLSVNILDRYLNKEIIHRNQLQLVGVTALLIAAKFEEIYPPEVRDCVYITDNAYDADDVLEMENSILVSLNYDLCVPTGYHFLVRYLTLINATDRIRFLANYYCERNLQEYETISQPPYKFAAAAVYAGLRQNLPAPNSSKGSSGQSLSSAWPAVLREETGLTDADLNPIAKSIIIHVGEEPVTASRRVLVATKHKYELEKFQSVARLPHPSF